MTYGRIGAATVASLALGLTALLVPAASAAPPPTGAAAQRSELTRLAKQLVAVGAPGVIVRVDDGHRRPIEIVEQAAWAERAARLSANDEFRMGSNTKTMMAVLVLQLVAAHRLALDDSVASLLPGSVPNGQAITLRMLLNHTSGLYDYTDDPELTSSIVGANRRTWTPAQLLAIGVRHAPLFAPGSSWSYSNTNYAAVGAVLQRVTGESLPTLVQDRIARPLHLTHTFLATGADTWTGPHAHGYEPDAAHMPADVPGPFRRVAGPHLAGHVDASDNNPSWGGAAGAVVSTAQDWARFDSALLSGRLLPPAELDAMLSTVPTDPTDPGGASYGLGIETGTLPCGTVWSHDGGITGYLSANITVRTGQRTASILIPTEFSFEFGASPKLAAAQQALNTATVCAMFDKPVPATSG